MTIAFFAPLLIEFSHHKNDATSMNLFLYTQNYFFIVFIGINVVLPDTFKFGAKSLAWTTGSEFLLTRSVDRIIVYRVRAVFFYILVLLAPLVMLLLAFRSPDLTVNEYNGALRHAILVHVPGSASIPGKDYQHLIQIPLGHVLIGIWCMVIAALITLVTQMILLVLWHIPYRTVVFFVVFGFLAFSPAFYMFYLASSIRSGAKEKIDLLDNAFVHFAQHPALYSLLAMVAIVVGQLWCERRFVKIEH